MGNKTIMETDIVKIINDGEMTGFYHVKDISPDHKPGWWLVTFELVNAATVVFTWLVDNDHLAGEPFTADNNITNTNILVSIELHSRVIHEQPKKVIDMTRAELNKHIDQAIESLF